MITSIHNLNWAYGVITTIERSDDQLPRTLKELERADFVYPTLFADNVYPITNPYKKLSCQVVPRFPRIGAFGNWLLAMWELYLRYPQAERYVLFEDDILCVNHLGSYLSRIGYPAKGYLNLYTVPQNEKIRPSNRIGFYLSNQMGRGALGLVFDQAAIRHLLLGPNFVHHVQNAKWGRKRIDGAVLEALRSAGIQEFVHYPSLLQHQLGTSTLQNTDKERPTSFPDTGFNAEDWLCNS